MWSLLSLIFPGLFNTVDGITKAISNERLALIQAKTDQEKIASQERIDMLQARRDVMLAEKDSKLNALMRFILALGPAAVLMKFYAWDKVVGSLMGCAGAAGQRLEHCTTFRTDPLDPNQWQIIAAVVGFYFLYEGFRAFKR